MSLKFIKELLLTLTRAAQVLAFFLLFLCFCASVLQPLFIREEGLYGVRPNGEQRPLIHPPDEAPNATLCKTIIHDTLFDGHYVRSLQYHFSMDNQEEKVKVIDTILYNNNNEVRAAINTVAVIAEEEEKEIVLMPMILPAPPLHNETPDKKDKIPVEIFDVCIDYHYSTSVSLLMSVFSKVRESEKKEQQQVQQQPQLRSPVMEDDKDKHHKKHRLAYLSIQAKEFFNFHVLQSKVLIEMLLGFVSFHAIMIVLSFVGCVVSLLKSSFLCSTKSSLLHAYQIARHRRQQQQITAASTVSVSVLDENGNVVQQHHTNLNNNNHHNHVHGKCCSCRCCCHGCQLLGGFSGISILLISLFVVFTCSFYDHSVHTHLLHPRFDLMTPKNESHNDDNNTNFTYLFLDHPTIKHHNNNVKNVDLFQNGGDEDVVVPDNETYKTCHYIDGCVTSYARDGFRPTVAPFFDFLYRLSLFIFVSEVCLCLLGGSRYYVQRARQEQQREAYEESVSDVVIVNGEEEETEHNNNHNNNNNNNNNVRVALPEQQQQQQQQPVPAAAAGGRNSNNNNINNVMNNNKKGGKAKNATVAPTTGEQGTADEREPLIH